MQVLDIIKRVQFKCDDLDGTYVTDDYVLAGLQDVLEWLYNKLKQTGSGFDSQVVVLPAVAAGTPDLNGFMASGQPLGTLVQPRMIRWKLPGQDPSYFRKADGPLDYQRDIINGIPALDSWAWLRYSIKLSSFSTALDLEVSGDFLFDPLTAPDSQIQIAQNANRVFSCKMASEVGKSRGNPKWEKTYGDDAIEALDDLQLIMTKARQAVSERVGRISRSSGNSTRISISH